MADVRIQDLATFATDLVGECEDDILENVERQLKVHSPVKTGRLRASFHRQGKRVISDVEYGGIVDHRRPFVDRAVDAGLDEVK